MARPKKIIDYDMAYKLARLHCTNEEIAAALDINETYWYKLIKRDKKLREAIEKARAEGRTSLRRMQWQTAAQGNVTMQIWLGKQLLSQNDIQRTELTGKDGEAIRIEEEAGAARATIEAAISRAAARSRTEASHIETESETIN